MTTTTNALSRLQDWYVAHCDGDWEHTYGVKITTLDNPGWQLIIDLEETELANKLFGAIERERDERDWVHCRVRESKFEGAGGPRNLLELIAVFLEWAAPS
jgi:Immunity protein 53